jgi:hypothetical protein
MRPFLVIFSFQSQPPTAAAAAAAAKKKKTLRMAQAPQAFKPSSLQAFKPSSLAVVAVGLLNCLLHAAEYQHQSLDANSALSPGSALGLPVC